MIAIFAGTGDYPKEIILSLKKSNKKFIILNISEKKIKNSFKINLGQFGKILKLLKDYKIHEVIFAGYVKRPTLSNMKLDIKAISYMPYLIKAFKNGDGNILNLAKKILNQNKIKVVESHKYSKNLLLKKTVTQKKPNKTDFLDAKKGKKILDNLSKFDNAQGVVIDEGYIVAIEAAEGTDNMLKRVIKLNKHKKKKSGVLIKFPKKNQNLKYDLPAIGSKTVKLCIQSKLNGIFLKKNQNIFLNQKISISLSNKNKFFISTMK